MKKYILCCFKSIVLRLRRIVCKLKLKIDLLFGLHVEITAKEGISNSEHDDKVKPDHTTKEGDK